MVQRVFKKSKKLSTSIHTNPSETVKSRKRGRPPINKIHIKIPSQPVPDDVSKVSASSDLEMDRRLTRSHSIQTILEDSTCSTPPIPITSDTNLWITESTPTKASRLRIHVLTDNTLHISEKNEIAVPVIQEYTISPRNTFPDRIHEELSDEAFHNRHRKNEMLEKKIKSRALEVYNYEMHLKKLEQDSKSVTDLNRSEELKPSQSVESLFIQATQDPSDLPFRVGAFQGREVNTIEEHLVQSLVKKHKLKSVYITPLDGAVPIPVLSDHKTDQKKPRKKSTPSTKIVESIPSDRSTAHYNTHHSSKSKKAKTQSLSNDTPSIDSTKKVEKSRNSWLNIFKRVFQ